jgi:hypothetical protein
MPGVLLVASQNADLVHYFLFPDLILSAHSLQHFKCKQKRELSKFLASCGYNNAIFTTHDWE